MAEHIQIGDVAPRIQYTGDGAQVLFTYPFPIFKTADMEVYLDEAKQATGFTVNGAGQSAGGAVTFTTAPANGVIVTLRRRLAIQRTSDFQESGEFRSKVINDELDYLTAALQQVSDDGERALRLSATDPTAALTLPDKAARAGMFLKFDAEGNAIVSDARGPQGPQGPAGNMDGSNNLAELTNPATARGNLGLGAAATQSVAGGGSAGLLRADGDGSALTGVVATDDAARANIVLNAFRIAVQGGLSVQNMVDGVVDEFEDQSGVDAATSTNESYDAAGDYYRPTVATGTDTYTDNLTDDHGADTPDNYSRRLVIPASQISTSGSRVRVTFKAPNTGTTVVDNAAIVERSGSTVNGVTTPAELKFGGASGFSIANGATVTSDWLEFALDESKDYLVVLDYAASGNSDGLYREAPNGHGSYTNTNGDSYNVASPSGFGALDQRSWVVTKIEVAATLNNMTLVSNATTALAQPDEAFIVAWQQDVAAVTLNTDLKAWASRDGGTTWTQITLAEEASLGASGRILAGTAGVSAQPAGTSMKWKLETLNAKDMKVHGVGLEWS